MPSVMQRAVQRLREVHVFTGQDSAVGLEIRPTPTSANRQVTERLHSMMAVHRTAAARIVAGEADIGLSEETQDSC